MQLKQGQASLSTAVILIAWECVCVYVCCLHLAGIWSKGGKKARILQRAILGCLFFPTEGLSRCNDFIITQWCMSTRWRLIQV